jgi:hypothetical protein
MSDCLPALHLNKDLKRSREGSIPGGTKRSVSFQDSDFTEIAKEEIVNGSKL